ncbi:hypothetical protein BC940DRAFT_243648 [Gongronella butleri]|nr:hypothetical protein BC940DRAFT_243648 [Gongronella butleri]
MLNFASLVLLLCCLSSVVKSVSLVKRGYTLQLNSDSSFCTFMPPHYGDNVENTENKGIPQCTSAGLSSSGRVFPSGFIKSSHYLINNSEHYVQVTGRINRKKYGLKASDEGGQYDYKHIKGVVCDGYKYFVSLLEPNDNRFCIRCCKYSRDCVTDKDTKGCPAVIPGDYS